MRAHQFGSLGFALGLSVVAAGCSGETPETQAAQGDELASADGTPLEFRFESTVVAAAGMPAKNAAIAQLEYLQGILTTGSGGNAQFRFVDITNVRERPEGAKTRTTYSASVSVIVPAGQPVPRRYDLALPIDVTTLDAFNEKYDGRCGTNEYGRQTFWHDFNPRASGCVLDADVHKTVASVRTHPLGTTDKYPEYDQIWSDGSLDMVAVYGAISSTSENDDGVRDQRALLAKVKAGLTNVQEAEVPPRGGIVKHTVLSGTRRIDGADKKVRLVTYFVGDVSSAGPEFTESYAEASLGADLIVYSGHSGLGTNIAALANATRAKRGQYQIVFFNGCQTLGYLGPAMHESRIALNGRREDPHGTKFLDVIVTALPAYAEQTPTEQLLFDAAIERKKGWGELLRSFSQEQRALHLTSVFGEDDNTFRP